MPSRMSAMSFFFNDTATTEIYTLSLHDALPIAVVMPLFLVAALRLTGRQLSAYLRSLSPAASASLLMAGDSDRRYAESCMPVRRRADRKSTRLNSSHGYISYAVFCLKKKKELQ